MATVLLALAASLLVHWLTYLLVYPESDDRQAALTGHGYFDTIAALSLPAALVSFVCMVAHGTHSPLAADPVTVRRLFRVGGMIFVAQEVLESVVADPTRLTGMDPVLVVGVCLQLPIAVLLVALLRLSTRAAIALFARAAARRAAAPLLRHPDWVIVRPALALLSTISPRGPPPVR